VYFLRKLWVIIMYLKKKYIMISVTIFIISIIIFPIFVNYIASADWGFQVSNNSTWIGFYATFIGSVLSGIISGSLTLGGVYLTIKNQEKKTKQNEFPKVSLNMDFVLEKMQEVELIENFLKKKEYYHAIGVSEDLLKFKEDVLQKSANVNAVFYRINRDLLKEIERVVKLKRLVKYGRDDLNQEIPLYDSLDEFEDVISGICERLLTGKAYLNKEYEYIIEYYQDSII